MKEGLFWNCHICGEERPDACISVRVRDMSEEYQLPPGTMKQNVRYCNDRTDCVQKSVNYKLIGNDG